MIVPSLIRAMVTAWFGPEFLIWIPGANPQSFATFFCGNKTMRREAPNLRGLIGRAATLKVTLIETKKYSWHGPVVVPCSTPFDLPDMEEIKAQVSRFNNPPEQDVEKAEEDVRDR